MKKPNDFIYTEDDLKTYASILTLTNAYKQGDKLKGNKGHKYTQIIKKILPFKSSGAGLLSQNSNKTDYMHWDDPNELCKRLRLLISSQNAGHSGHENEIISTIEDLREAKIIK